MSRKLTTEEFIQKAHKVHGNKFDYSKVIYVNNHTKVCIICPLHGEFYQTPNHHLRERGCDKCGGTFTLTTESFIEKSKQVHGNKYDYSKTIYKGCFEKVYIICPEHGEFWQAPHSHLRKQGCSKCVGLNKKSTDEFIIISNKVHGDKYDYSKVVYINNHTKVCIICPKHGEFWQRPQDHLNWHGCPKCNYSKGELQIEKWLTEHSIKHIPQYKFDECKNKRKLAFDFYLSDYNLCIEYDGEQHFKPMGFGGDSQEIFKRTKNNDDIKNLLMNLL